MNAKDLNDYSFNPKNFKQYGTNKPGEQASQIPVLNAEKWLNESYDLKETSKYEYRSGRVLLKDNPLRTLLPDHNIRFAFIFDVTDAQILR